jgi:hypothetical protein
MKRALQVKFVDADSGLDAACAPLERIAALFKALEKALPELPGTVPDPVLQRVFEILRGTAGESSGAGAVGTADALGATDAEKDVVHVPFRGDHGEVNMIYDLHGERARAHARRMQCTVDHPDGTSEDFV